MKTPNPYDYEIALGRCTTEKDIEGNARIIGVDMSFLDKLPIKESSLVRTAINRLAEFEDAEIASDNNVEIPITLCENNNGESYSILVNGVERFTTKNLAEAQALYDEIKSLFP